MVSEAVLKKVKRQKHNSALLPHLSGALEFHGARMTANASATAATRRADGNRNGPPPFLAANGQPYSH